jgi:hypothetical protein
MANDDWDVAVPIDHTMIKNVPSAIRDVVSSTKIVLAKEHATPSTDNAGGQHLKGSARAYLEAGHTSLDPEGNSLATSASTGDDGRISVDTSNSNHTKVYVATSAGVSTGWQDIRVGRLKLGEAGSAGGFNITALASGTQSGQAVHVGQFDTTYMGGVSTGLLQVKVSTGLQTSHAGGIIVSPRATASGTQVFSGTVGSASTFEDLDLSAVVGANAALVYLQVFCGSANVSVTVKPKGYGAAAGYHINNDASANGAGASVAAFIEADNYRYLMCWTDASGVIQLAASSSSATLSVRVIGYVK